MRALAYELHGAHAVIYDEELDAYAIWKGSYSFSMFRADGTFLGRWPACETRSSTVEQMHNVISSTKLIEKQGVNSG